MTMKESPVFARTHDLVLWLIERTMSFPRSQRFVLTKRVQDAALNFQERLIEAGLSRGNERRRRLAEADVELGKLRFYLRMCHELAWLSTGQYAHVSRVVAEVGRLLGGWIKTSGAARAGA
jgi:four helix bundle protein